MFGDFNLSLVNWNYDCNNAKALLLVNATYVVECDSLYLILAYGLHQVNNCFKHMNRLLKLVFSNFSENISVSSSEHTSRQ